jgi:6-pyruvoyltetrahydropterin/6-carboxytetrahydropterin synthase
MILHLVKTFYAEAAHANPQGTPAQQRLHGHSYKIDLLAKGEPNEEYDWVIDFRELKQKFKPLYRKLDHGYLNKISGLEDDTSLAAIAIWIEKQLSPTPAWFAGVRISIVGDLCFKPRQLEASETEELPERIRFSFEAAQSLPQLPAEHPCNRMHGHSYHIEVGAENLETLEAHLADLYSTLDHQCLNDITGLGYATSERICIWVWQWLEEKSVTPTVVVIQETGSARCIYYGV